jgi:hypothetical protein
MAKLVFEKIDKGFCQLAIGAKYQFIVRWEPYHNPILIISKAPDKQYGLYGQLFEYTIKPSEKFIKITKYNRYDVNYAAEKLIPLAQYIEDNYTTLTLEQLDNIEEVYLKQKGE